MKRKVKKFAMNILILGGLITESPLLSGSAECYDSMFSKSTTCYINNQIRDELSVASDCIVEYPKDLKEKFNEAFEKNIWGDSESVSGSGSTLAYTSSLRKTFPAIVAALECKIILDAPCGDYNWMKEINLGDVIYIGGDIASILVKDLQSKYSSVDFRQMDITTSALPDADLWLCRDVLFHLSNADIQKVINNFKKSNIKYFATSYYYNEVNFDFESGPRTYRPINLTKAPFNLPYPDYVLKDWVPGWPQRWIGIWDRDQINF